jgi:HD-like signal output (HDOD) protein
VAKLVQAISYDKSLVAQCLRMANSPLYRQRGDVNTVGEAVLTLGILRIRDLVYSCAMPRMFMTLNGIVPKEVFWRHALGTALLSQCLSEKCGEHQNQNIYISGLLHDIGILINALLFPEDFQHVMRGAVTERSPISLMEQRILGFTHAESGRILADAWKLPLEVSEAIEFHHCADPQARVNESVFFVHLADQLCLSSELGYGYELRDGEITSVDGIWQALINRFPKARRLTLETFAAITQSTLSAARQLADRVFGHLRQTENLHSTDAGPG